jgi:hypothetical protein
VPRWGGAIEGSDNFYKIEALAVQTNGVPPSRRRREIPVLWTIRR